VTGIIDKYTPDRVQKIINALRAGNHLATAARYAGVSPNIVKKWVELYPEFALAVDEADAASEVRNVAIIQKEAEKRWVAAAWLLERKYPEKWGKVDRVEIYQIQKQAEAIIEELKAEGIEGVTVEQILQERQALVDRSAKALPAPKDEVAAA
jgi:transposase-like protein